MRFERWYALILFCAVSLGIHLGIVYHTPPIQPTVAPIRPTEIEVSLIAPPETTKPPDAPKKPVEKPRPTVKQPPKPGPSYVVRRAPRTTPKTPVEKTPTPSIPASDKAVAATETRPITPNAAPGGVDRLKEEKPITAGLPSGVHDAGVPKLTRVARLDPNPGGGGTPAPGLVPNGHGGAPRAEAPPEDIIFNGGGAGGEKLPKAAPRMGGGGGRSILSVENPLAKELIPEEKPGLGPGLAGGQGAGAGGGVGYSRDKGIGTRLDGKVALGTLLSKPGPGIGAGSGSGIGTNPPGGGKGTGAELPGTGGTGIGYGRGSGVGVGEGSGLGVGNGAGNRVGLSRGIPFGDVAGLLLGDKNGGGGSGGGPGGPGRGAVFGAAPKGGGDRVHIVYLLDVSGSMEQGNKIGKAKEALKKALGELRPRDTFNVITFFANIRAFSDSMVQATRINVQTAELFIDFVELKNGTNLSMALEAALSLNDISHIFVLSDGEPTQGILSSTRLRAMVRELNTKHVKIITLALGLGEQFPGMALLRGLADDNDGQYSYVNLRR